MTPTARIRLGARIARGGMAEVFAARLVGPAGFEKNVAVKRVLPRFANDPVFLQRFLAEARLAARLSHPNIVQIFELGNDGEDHYIVMEAVRGVTLRRLLVRLAECGERLPPAVALFIARCICAGLAHAHELLGPDGQPLQVIHRDVSPPNVLLGHEGSVKLIDFGIAQARDSERLTRVGRPIGKPHYMAPEQFRSGPLDPRADLHAVGVLLHEMLTGERPFEADNEVELVRRIRRGERRSMQEVAPDLEAPLVTVIDQALALRREDRPASARAFGAALAEVGARLGQRADAHDLETLLARLFPDEAARPWPVEDVRVDESEHTRTSSGDPDRREITLSSEGSSTVLTDEVTSLWTPPPEPSSSSPSSPSSSRWPGVLAAASVAVVAVIALVVGMRAGVDDEAVPTAIDAGVAGVAPAIVDAGSLAATTDPADAGDSALAVAFVDGGVVEVAVADAGVDASDGTADDAGVRDDRLTPPRPKNRTPGRAPKAATKLGRLIVETRPWSEVKLDGQALGVTPLQHQVRRGRHQLVLTNPELGLRRELTVVVDGDDPVVVRVDLRAP